MDPIVILGGGITGLLAAHFLERAGKRVILLEKSARYGGWICSQTLEGRTFEWGPHTLLADAGWLKLIEDLGLQPEFASPAAKRRFLWMNERLQRVPSNPWSLLSTPLLTSRTKRRLFRDVIGSRPSLGTEDLSVYEFCRYYLDSEVAERLVEPFFRGIYAGDIKELSAQSCLPLIWEATQTTGSLLRAGFKTLKKNPRRKSIGFRGGLQTLTDALARSLQNRPQVSLRLAAAVSSITRQHSGWKIAIVGSDPLLAKQIIFTLPAFAIAPLLSQQIPSSAEKILNQIPYRRVAVWNTAFTRPKNFQSGFGCLIPQTENEKISGSLWNSEVFPSRCPPNELIAAQFFSGESIPNDTESELPFLQALLGIHSAPLMSEMRVYDKALPQMLVGHREKIRALKSALPPGLFLAGNYLEGPGLKDCFRSAAETAAVVASTPGLPDSNLANIS